MPNNLEFEIDRAITISDAVDGYPCSIVSSEQTLTELIKEAKNGWWLGKEPNIFSSYKGHPIIIDNNLELGKYIIVKKGEDYNAE